MNPDFARTHLCFTNCGGENPGLLPQVRSVVGALRELRHLRDGRWFDVQDQEFDQAEVGGWCVVEPVYARWVSVSLCFSMQATRRPRDLQSGNRSIRTHHVTTSVRSPSGMSVWKLLAAKKIGVASAAI